MDTQHNQTPWLMDNPSDQLDPYTSPKDYQIFYAFYKASQNTKP